MSANNTQQPSPKNISLEDAESFQSLFRQYHLSVFRFIYGMYGSTNEDVEDLTAEVFTRAWKSRRRFRGSRRAALGWLLKIARNLVIDTYRKQKTRGFSQDIDKHIIVADEPDPESQAILREQTKKLWSILYTLSDQQREILVLRYILGWRVQDIGEHLDMNENTVSVYIRRAIRSLQQKWPKESGEYE